MTRAAKATLTISAAICAFTVYGVHWLQFKERDDMYQGVLKDEARIAEKKRQREAEFQESMKKRELYERYQEVGSAKEPDTAKQ
ncbi:hypothetical protein FRB94_000963 [Tulasnella sp. JGI-2019a]|nr:hypothetical protein FRB94_000963 [Tulasnella sp. JGI-2019a]KAG9018342.1 hypothetical protein FRB93_000045 [Tulasnella sp. JGI-2019a]KAG9029326.1 hypothetical protein FRB95_005490 [Tulasnella sp. JGI-2019a]